MNFEGRTAHSEAMPSIPPLYPFGTPVGRPSDPTAHGSVAIIMRTKNRPILVHRALCSVLFQSHVDWRLYLVNDGGDKEVLERLLDRYRSAFGDRLVVVHHDESRGMENASNAGLSRAEEEFAVIHDDDDTWHPHFLEATTDFLSKPANSHCVGVTTGCHLIQEIIRSDLVEEVSREVWQHNRAPLDLGKLLKENLLPPICLVFRRGAVEKIGSFNGDLPVLGDWDFNLRLMLLGDIDFIPDMLARYHHRIRGSGAVYGNTVVDGTALHARQNILYRNSLLRSALLERPENLGAVQAMLHAIAAAQPRPMPPPRDRSGEILQRLHSLEKQTKDLQRSINRLKPKKPPPAQVRAPTPAKPKAKPKSKPKPNLLRRARNVVSAPVRWIWRAVYGGPAQGK